MNKKLLATLLLTATTAPVWAVPITVTSNRVAAYAYDGAYNHQIDTSTSINHSVTLSASAGNSAATTDISWSGDDNGTAFRFDTAHSFDNANTSRYDYAQSYASSVYFTATETIDYGISGFYTASGGEANRTYQSVYLYDHSARTHLFYDYAYSDYTVDESFTLGDGTGGDRAHNEFGSLTGSLIAGHRYQFHFNQYIQDYPRSGAAGSAVGQVCLVTGNGNCSVAVPEPMSLGLLGLGLFGISLRRFGRSTPSRLIPAKPIASWLVSVRSAISMNRLY